MGREATITAEQVHSIADAIKAAGGTPTLRSVRERLGTGSMGTISKWLQNWKAGQERPSVGALTLPPALQRVVLDYMATELAATRAPLESELAEQQQAAHDLATENERLMETIEDQAIRWEQMASEKASVAGKAEQLATDLASMKDEASRERQSAENARTELAKSQLRLEAMPRLEADLATTRVALDSERQARIDAEQKAAVLVAQKTDLEGRLMDTRTEAGRTAEQLAKAQARIDQLADDLRTANEKASIGLAAERQMRIDAEQKAAVLASQKVDLEGRLMDARRGDEKSAATPGAHPKERPKGFPKS